MGAGGSARLGARLAGFGSTALVWVQEAGKEAASPGGEKDARAPSALVTVCFSLGKAPFPGSSGALAPVSEAEQGRPRHSGGPRHPRAKVLGGTPARGEPGRAEVPPARVPPPPPRPPARASPPPPPRCSPRRRPRAPGGRRLGMFPSVPSLPPR